MSKFVTLCLGVTFELWSLKICCRFGARVGSGGQTSFPPFGLERVQCRKMPILIQNVQIDLKKKKTSERKHNASVPTLAAVAVQVGEASQILSGGATVAVCHSIKRPCCTHCGIRTPQTPRSQVRPAPFPLGPLPALQPSPYPSPSQLRPPPFPLGPLARPATLCFPVPIPTSPFRCPHLFQPLSTAERPYTYVSSGGKNFRRRNSFPCCGTEPPNASGFCGAEMGLRFEACGSLCFRCPGRFIS